MIIAEQLHTELNIQGKTHSSEKWVIVGGMGGSRLPAEFFRAEHPEIHMQVWKSYGLPPAAPESALYIVSSYSGNTREALSFFDDALANGYRVAAITGGGELLERARGAGVPFIQIPWREDVSARRMLPIALRALSLLVAGEDGSVRDGFAAADRVGAYSKGASLSGLIPAGTVPMFYASEKNAIIAEYARIEVCETAHIPAGWNTFPEFLHNELAAYARENTRIVPVFFFDPSDDERAVKDARNAMRFLEKKGYAPISIDLNGSDRYAILAEAILTAQGLADALASDRVPTPDFMREFREVE